MEHKMRKMDQNNNHPLVAKRPDRPDVTRRKRKPLMEKRRRARINASLEQLKKLVLDATRRDSARYSKLEKADILELTVKHIKEVNRTGHGGDPAQLFARLHDGFGECVAEVNRCLSVFEGVNPELHNRLMGHLSVCLQRRSPAVAMPTQSGSPPHFPPHQHSPHSGHSHYPLSPLAHFPATAAASLALNQAQRRQQHEQQQRQDLAVAALHNMASPHSVPPRATPLHNLPGAAPRETVRNIQGSTSPSSPLDSAFHDALIQVQKITDIHERAAQMERLFKNASHRHNEQALSEMNRLNSLKHEPELKKGRLQENLNLREKLLALQQEEENVWRPW